MDRVTTMSTEDKLDQYRADHRKPRPDKPTNLDPLVAAFLGRLVPRPDGAVPITEFSALFRASLRGSKQREHATRKAIIACLARLGIPIGETYDHRRCVIGYSIDPALVLVVDEAGRIREVA